MTARSIRRAQERRANKLARKAAKSEPLQTQPIPSRDCQEAPMDPRPTDRNGDPKCGESPDPRPTSSSHFAEPRPAGSVFDEAVAEPAISPARLAANRSNAQLSTGPKTSTGKAKSRLNAVTTALTGRTVLLSTDDAVAYESHVQAYAKEFAPVGSRECNLVQSIADIWWRLRRAVALQMGIFAQGQIEFAHRFDDHDVSVRRGLIEVHTFLTYEKQLRNLQLQEARLSRRREKETAELRDLQQDRKAKEREQLDLASRLYVAAQHDHKSFDPAAHGFEFSTKEIERYLERLRAAQSRKTVAQAA